MTETGLRRKLKKIIQYGNQQQERLLQTVKGFSDDINMNFGLDKCATAEFKRGKLTKTTSSILDEETAIKELQQEDSYKYLGIDEAEGIEHAKMKEKIRKEYDRRVRLILKSELNAVLQPSTRLLSQLSHMLSIQSMAD